MNNAGAALFKNAMAPVASTSGGSSGSLLSRMQMDAPAQRVGAGASLSSQPQHLPTGPRRGVKGKGRASGASSVAADEDIGMQDASGANRRGRTGRKASGPMGDRTQRSTKKNSPAQLRGGEKKGKGATGTSKAAGGTPTKQVDISSSKNLETIRVFLTSRYSPELKMLNLENMASDNVLREAGITPPGHKGASTALAGAMWKMAKQLFPDIVSLVLANNGLTSLLPLSPFHLTNYLPGILNVSLAGNSLRNMRDLDCLSPHVGKQRTDGQQKGWAQLRELVLIGNPLVVTGTGEAKYKSEIARRFPTLAQLDQQPFDPSVAFNVTAAAASSAANRAAATPGLSPAAKRSEGKRPARPPLEFPLPVKGAFYDADSTRDFVGGFLAKFFSTYDTDRPSLQSVYAPLCTFSLSADTAVPVRSRVRKIGSHGDRKFPNQHKLDWKDYLSSGSRNLLRTKRADRRFATIQMSPADVTASITTLPKTQHPLSDASKFVFDAFLMPGLLPATPEGGDGTAIFASVHGEFTELSSKGVRSFSRTFLLAPASPGSAAQIAGWPCVILSDQLTVRGYTEPTAWQPRPANPSTAATPNGTNAKQEGLIKALCEQTKLTPDFSRMCLEQNNWDPNLALANFNELNAQGAIPREGFIM